MFDGARYVLYNIVTSIRTCPVIPIKKTRQRPYKPGSVPQGKPCGALSSI